MSNKILLVDDELEMCLSLSEILKSEGYKTIYTVNPLETLDILEKEKIKLLIIDIKMPQIEGIDLLKIIKRKIPSLPVIMITGFPSIENAVRAMKYGASNFFIKPPKLDELLNEIKRIITTTSRKKDIKKDEVECNIITQNTKIKKILKSVKKAAPTSAPVLITGESGTGKELIANYLHCLSDRKDRPFVKVNCAALTESLLESELFGHERGAFTNAIEQRKGRFEIANKGTIFLDEIGDMSINTQAKILRVLQEKEFERVGGSKTIETDIRVIAATNKDIKRLIAEEKFREDLYYRLTVITIHLPPLRERKDDIIILVDYFINYYNEMYSKKVKKLSIKVKDFFIRHDWPGNIRELKNCIERAIIFSDDDEIKIDDLPTQYNEFIDEQPITSIYGNTIDNINREVILDALAKSKGVKQKAAELLNINRRTLYNRMKKLGLK
jgi:DNA-binding NtrC family response regulator